MVDHSDPPARSKERILCVKNATISEKAIVELNRRRTVVGYEKLCVKNEIKNF